MSQASAGISFVSTFSTQLRRLATGFSGDIIEWMDCGHSFHWSAPEISMSLVSVRKVPQRSELPSGFAEFSFHKEYTRDPLSQCNVQISPPSAIAPLPFMVTLQDFLQESDGIH